MDGRFLGVTHFRKILIANRGEIARRIMRTARAMAYRTVAVYSDADRDMPYVGEADQAVPIGPAPATESYLSVERILAAARRSGAEAIHPGYGFLAENAVFAEACATADLVFIGPPAAAIRLMGNKASAKCRMREAGVPCVPGYDGADQGDETLAAEAAAIGFPVMVKAAAGGGGKGMRRVGDAARLMDALRGARAEAEKAFGSGELILEKEIDGPRHIEIQVFADQDGNTVHLGERDCSIQRRHQKVIEEAPSPALGAALRAAMGAAAVAAARAIGYVGAGTIEFLLASDGQFYFLEMNTRLQVEHAVTEMTTGIDLVEWQLRVAAGEVLPKRQEEIASHGHAIEARLYAEDPEANFLPQAGRLVAWEPPAGAGIRVDDGVASGLTISPHYDPMLAKIIAHGETRELARRRIIAALEETVALGIATNRRFLIGCLSHPAFAAGAVDTGFVDRHLPGSDRAVPDGRLIALAAAVFDHRSAEHSDGVAPGWRSLRSLAGPMLLKSGETKFAVEIARESTGRRRVVGQGGARSVEIVAIAGSRIRFLCDGLAETAQFARDGDVLHLSLGEATAAFEDVLLAGSAAAAGASGNAAVAPMTGTVSLVRVRPGDCVRKGQCLVILEAMKMEHEIVAPRDGTVAAVLVSQGEQVPTRKPLVELAPEAAA
ncbi:MAG TPA: acetyl-CoA carboxylase biotin carboxylase subunit [Stellaceae bacterium]|nr:acetyl-CoA carboxylase biotin carboxylase subunit [Stellaceae bacterium]